MEEGKAKAEIWKREEFEGGGQRLEPRTSLLPTILNPDDTDKTLQGYLSSFKTMIFGTTDPDPSHEFLSRLVASGRPIKELAAQVIGLAVGSSVNYAQGQSLCPSRVHRFLTFSIVQLVLKSSISTSTMRAQRNANTSSLCPSRLIRLQMQSLWVTFVKLNVSWFSEGQ